MGRILILSALLLTQCRVSRPEAAGVGMVLTVYGVRADYATADVSLSAPKAGVVWAQHLERLEEVERVAPLDWYRGAGRYVLRFAFVRADGGTGEETLAIELEGNEVALEGSISLFGDPELSIKIFVPPPDGLRIELASDVSAQGSARYVIRNQSERAWVDAVPSVVFERWDDGRWASAGPWFMCQDVARPVLAVGAASTLDLSDTLCLVDALAPGRYRHSVRLAAERGDQRVAQLSREFEITKQAGNGRAHVLADVPVEGLRLSGALMSTGDTFVSGVVAPDGRSACICPKILVGKERLEAMEGTSGPCLTKDPAAAVVECDRLYPSLQLRELGDHPPFGKPWDSNGR